MTEERKTRPRVTCPNCVHYIQIISQLKEKIKMLEMNEQLLKQQTENFHQSSRT